MLCVVHIYIVFPTPMKLLQWLIIFCLLCTLGKNYCEGDNYCSSTNIKAKKITRALSPSYNEVLQLWE